MGPTQYIVTVQHGNDTFVSDFLDLEKSYEMYERLVKRFELEPLVAVNAPLMAAAVNRATETVAFLSVR